MESISAAFSNPCCGKPQYISWGRHTNTKPHTDTPALFYAAHTFKHCLHEVINTRFTHGLGVLSCICRCLPHLNDLSFFRLSVAAIWLCNYLTLTRPVFEFFLLSIASVVALSILYVLSKYEVHEYTVWKRLCMSTSKPCAEISIASCCVFINNCIHL